MQKRGQGRWHDDCKAWGACGLNQQTWGRGIAFVMPTRLFTSLYQIPDNWTI